MRTRFMLCLALSLANGGAYAHGSVSDVGVGAIVPDDGVMLIDGAAVPTMRLEKTKGNPPSRTESQIAEASAYVEVGEGSSDLVSTTVFGDCRLHVEWYCPPGGGGQMAANSGVYLQNRYEIQVLGTEPGATPPAPNEAGAIYGIKAADRNASTGTGTWQAYDIAFRAPRFADGKKSEDARVTVHWNGVLVHDDVAISHPTGSRRAGGESADGPVQLGPLRLQDHASKADGAVRYRNVWIAPLEPASYEPGEWITLIDKSDDDRWVVRGGDAVYRVEDGVLIGTTRPNTPNTFYTSRQTYDDFELRYETLVDPELNSGVQIRSEVVDGFANRGGGLRGYQIELDPSPRAFSGGVYEERRRGWLHPLHDSPRARDAFKAGEWNAFRVVARGPVIRTWINGVPVATVFDAMSGEGHIGLQVHGVGAREDPLEVRFRNVRLRPLTLRAVPIR